jgi:transposase
MPTMRTSTLRKPGSIATLMHVCSAHHGIFLLTPQWIGIQCGINTFTGMPNQYDPSAKVEALKAAGTFNPRADKVRHRLFAQSEFFDPHDLPQLKYEALRALEAEGYSVAQAAGEFGLSRPTLYQAQDQFQQQGLEGLLPHKRGPKKPHKLTLEVRQHLQELAASAPELNAQELARRLRQKFKVKIHPRTLEKALQARAKKGALPPRP